MDLSVRSVNSCSWKIFARNKSISQNHVSLQFYVVNFRLCQIHVTSAISHKIDKITRIEREWDFTI